MKKLALITIIFITMALPIVFATLVMASPGAPLEPSFETVNNWTYSETDADYDGAQSTVWKTQGTYSYMFSSVKAPALDTYCQIAQSVDFTDLDMLSFDANLWQEDTGINRYRASVYVGATEVWWQVCPSTATDYLNQEVDVSGYTGTLDLIFRVTCIDASTPFNQPDQTNYFDNIKTYGSYEDSGYTTVQNNFTSGKNQVWIKATNLDNVSDDYKTAFYDASATGGGAFIAYIVNSTDANGDLTGPNCNFLEHPTATGDGDWHAVLFYPATTEAPATYNLATASGDKEVEDAFYVTQAAIPEFPTIMAAIGVVGLCFGIYYWMRKRRLAHVQA